MRLVRLLTAGKSLVGLESDAPRYKETDPKSIPQFKPKKNPFRKRAEPAQNGNPASNPRSAGGTQSTQVANQAGTVQPRGRKSGWLAKVGSWLAPRKKQPKSAVPQFMRPPMQGELRLDNVKVVRNDLSDADIEVVPAKAAAAKAKEAGPVQPTAEREREVAAEKS